MQTAKTLCGSSLASYVEQSLRKSSKVQNFRALPCLTLSFNPCRLPLTPYLPQPQGSKNQSQDGPSLPLQELATPPPPVQGVTTGLGLLSAVLVWCSLATPLRRLRPAHGWVLGFSCWLFFLVQSVSLLLSSAPIPRSPK